MMMQFRTQRHIRFALLIEVAVLLCMLGDSSAAHSLILHQNVQQEPKRIHLSGGVVAGHLIQRVFPTIPKEALRQHQSGVFTAHAVIGTDGKIKGLEPIYGSLVLRPYYMDAIRQWTYEPFVVDGEPVEVDTTITFNIQLNASAMNDN